MQSKKIIVAPNGTSRRSKSFGNKVVSIVEHDPNFFSLSELKGVSA